MPHHQKATVFLLLRLAKEPFGICESCFHVAANVWYYPLSVHHWKRGFVLFKLVAQLPGTFVVVGKRLSDVPAGRDQRAAHFDSHRELA